MASQPIKGRLALASIVTVGVEAFKATEPYAGASATKWVCACHHKPFTKKDTCAESGAPRETKELVKKGQKGAKGVRAVEKPDGTFVALADDLLAQIDASIDSNELSVIGIEPADNIPLTRGDSYHLQPAKDATATEAETLAAFAGMLSEDDTVAVIRYVKRGHEYTAALIPGDTLQLVVVRYTHEQVEPSDAAKQVMRAAPNPKAHELLRSFLNELPTVDWGALEDRGITLKNEAVRNALAGKTPVATTEVQAQPEAQAENMLAMLEKAASKPKAKAKK